MSLIVGGLFAASSSGVAGTGPEAARAVGAGSLLPLGLQAITPRTITLVATRAKPLESRVIGPLFRAQGHAEATVGHVTTSLRARRTSQASGLRHRCNRGIG